MMDVNEQIEEAYKSAKNYPDMVGRLISAGINSYTVDTNTGTILYRLNEGKHVLHSGTFNRDISAVFNESETIKAIRDNQQGKTDYPGFMNAIAKAGVRFYEATLEGDDKRVTYVGANGYYEERIPGQT